MNELKRGMMVTVLNCDHNGRYFIEGQANLVKPTEQTDVWYVRFAGESDTYRRYISIEAQSNPDAYIAMLNNNSNTTQE